MASPQDASDFLNPEWAAGFQLPADLTPWITLLGILGVSIVVNLLLPRGPKVPIALADEIAGQKKRIEQYSMDSRNILIKGYKKFKGQIFGLDTSEGVALVLPTPLIDELKSHPALSFSASFDSLTLPEYTRIKPIAPNMLKIFTGKLNPTLGDFMPGIQNLFHDELLKAIPESKEWKSVKIYPILFDLACKSAARTLLTEEASKNSRWIQTEADYISTAIPYIQGLKKWPSFLRPFVYKNVEGYETLRKQWAEGRAVISDCLEKKRANNWEPLQNPPTFFDHVCAQHPELTADDHLSMQITMFIAGVHTSAATSTQFMFDAAVNGACIEEIRQEVKAMHEQCGGNFTRKDLGNLTKLDSFLKEVLRFSSPDLVTFVRKNSKSITLSNGFQIPNNTKIQVATGAINLDEELHPNPTVFDGLRFWKLRQQQDQATKHQFTSVSKRDLDWGYGRHACPGRYMAEISIKLIIIELVLNFEIKNPEGKGRHPNIEFDAQTMPDTEAEVLMRRI